MSSHGSSRVQPARLSFLAIYNPALGVTDETFADQCVYWYSRKATEARSTAKKNGRVEAAGGDAAREDENEKLRQIGLAQGMVDFAKSFSNGQPVDSIETEKSRVVLHELEQGWWVLASVDLTRLPAIAQAPAEPLKKGAQTAEPKLAYEYSSREVSPPAFLTQQLLQAHNIFLLHHTPSLDELFVRLTRDKFCSALDRFWSRFTRTWDVLLHGNPAADAFGGLKLASGGELGFGVGEEEWGSGEREVLEDLAHRTEGLVDLVVSRFGEPARAVASDGQLLPESEALPWMGSGSQPAASDGVVFGGVGAIARPSLRNVSSWMRQIYTYGEYAYGVRDNPVRERRKRRRRNPPPDFAEPANGSVLAPSDPPALNPRKLRQRAQHNAARQQADDGHDVPVSEETAGLPKDPRPELHHRVASQDHALEDPSHTPPVPLSDNPGIPPSIVAAAGQALERATQKAESEAEREDVNETTDPGSTWGVPDTYMKYLTFGLSELAKPSKPARPKRPDPVKRTTTSSSTTIRPVKNNSRRDTTTSTAASAKAEELPTMTHVDPTPEGEPLEARLATQRWQENRGYFVIGLKGELDTIPDEGNDGSDDGLDDEGDGSRTILRTLQIEIAPIRPKAASEDETLNEALRRTADDAETNNPVLKNMQRVRVLIYVCRPFMYCFLFENRTSSLAYSGFYKELHRTLTPIHKPLLSSTNVAKVAQRIESSAAETAEDTASVRSLSSNMQGAAAAASASRPIFDLIYDPRLLTVHTSIPNIPEPGTPAAEGLTVLGQGQGTLPAGWTRLDALNVHSQVLSTFHNVKTRKAELERTSKTSRGWWVVWMRVPPSAAASNDARSGAKRASHAPASSTAPPNEDNPSRGRTGPSTYTGHSTHIPSVTERTEPEDMSRMAFLVRKASDALTGPAAAKASTGSRMASGMWSTLTLRPAWDNTAEEKTGGAGAGWGPAALSGGIGIDARRYVEGLLSLNR